MGDRMNEFKGNVKKTVGDMTDNERMEAEGESERTSAKASREVKGAANKAKGAIKEGIGGLTGDTGMEAEGRADRVKGSGQQAG
jgi:uncharacterized protein YjbJ (UPF0337 family)